MLNFSKKSLNIISFFIKNCVVLDKFFSILSARKNITASLVDKKVIVFSRTIPEHMLDQEYCIIQSPWGYALKNLQPIATEIKNFFQKIQDQTAHSTGKAAAVFKYTETKYKKAALPFMSCAKIFPWFPHAYILKSDLDELPLQQQKVIHHLMSEDTMKTLLLLPGTISRELNALKNARWLKALREKQRKQELLKTLCQNLKPSKTHKTAKDSG